MITSISQPEIQIWPMDRLNFYVRNPRKNDHVVDRMCSSIREFGFKIPVLARSDGEVVDGHLRLKAARKLGITEIPVILCDEWTPAQVKAFRLLDLRARTAERYVRPSCRSRQSALRPFSQERGHRDDGRF